MAVILNDQITINKTKELAANAAAPSNRIENLAWISSGTTLTAPSDGYIYLEGAYGSTGLNDFRYIEIRSLNGSGLSSRAYGNNQSAYTLTLPVSKGTQFKINYNISTTPSVFRFVYRVGAI